MMNGAMPTSSSSSSSWQLLHFITSSMSMNISSSSSSSSSNCRSSISSISPFYPISNSVSGANNNLSLLLLPQTNKKTYRCASTQVQEVTKTNNENRKVGRRKSQFEIENLTSWLLKQERQGNIDAELTIVLSSISLACKQISSLLQRATISELTGSQGYINVQGEDQRKLDFIANQVFCDCLRSSGRTGIIASEEEEVPIAVEETYSGNYTVVFDPIDGSSNIDTALTTGSIFGIYTPQDHQCIADYDTNDQSMTLGEEEQRCVVSVCQPGRNLLAAGYCMYSSSVIFVLSVGKGVFSFTLDPMYGEFVLTQKNIQIPKSGKIYSFNEANYQLWDDKLKKYIDDLKVMPCNSKDNDNANANNNNKRYSARYIGCLVGEIHRTLLYGGIYGNPANIKRKEGNLRLLYECAPMSYLVEQAGGKATDGHRRILDIEPDEIHQRVPFFIGSPEEVEKLEKYLA
ncbi:Fructose-1 [Macleaya cordata]|uniref:fructose-bisphosphatase n=1 Tax=Macleaya cordata TaxID=56857 RepID=A0A200R0B8_MACCD|nr:Fructose-1 [Macleaya cordata]